MSISNKQDDKCNVSYSLSEEGKEQAVFGSFNIYGNDVAFEGTDPQPKPTTPKSKPVEPKPKADAPKKDPKQEELNRLYKLYWGKDEQFEKAKGKRTIITILVFSIFYYWILYITDEPSGIEILYLVLPAVFMAGFHFIINATIFSHLSAKGREENETLDSIKKRIREIEKEKGIPNYNDWRDD